MTARFLMILPVAILAFIGGMAVNQQANERWLLMLHGWDCVQADTDWGAIWECQK